MLADELSVDGYDSIHRLTVWMVFTYQFPWDLFQMHRVVDFHDLFGFTWYGMEAVGPPRFLHTAHRDWSPSVWRDPDRPEPLRWTAAHQRLAEYALSAYRASRAEALRTVFALSEVP